MRRTRVGFGIVAALVIFTIVGCANTPPTHFYLLRAQPPSGETRGQGTGVIPSLGIGPISIPKYLDRPQIVTQASRHELDLAEYHQWAEPLKERILQVLAENLSTSLTINEVILFPWKRSRTPDYHVTVRVVQFDGAKSKEVTLKGQWALFKNGESQALLHRSVYLAEPWTNSEYEGLVEAMSRVLGALSQEVAIAIHDISR